MSNAQLQGANLTGPSFRGRIWEGRSFRARICVVREIWLARFPDDLADQSPGPLGVADLELSTPTAEAKAELKQKLQANITDDELLERLLDRLKPILRDDPAKWEDEDQLESVRQPGEGTIPRRDRPVSS